MNKKSVPENFFRDGYVIAGGLLSWELDLIPLLDDYTAHLDYLARQWVAAGRLSSIFEGLPFDRRFMKIVGEIGRGWVQYVDITLPPEVVEETPIHLGEAVFNWDGSDPVCA